MIRHKTSVWGTSTIAVGDLKTRIGKLRIIAGPDGVMQINLPRSNHSPSSKEKLDNKTLRLADGTCLPIVSKDPRLDLIRSQLEEFFAGERTQFDLPFQHQVSAFDRLVLMAVGEVEYGRVATYGQIAERIGKPKAARAVGAANGRNPLPLLIPCHRIVGSGGRMTGYGGGLDLKAALLRLEGIQLSSRDLKPSTRVVITP